MKLVIFTLVLDGMPFLKWHLPTFDRLNIPWEWIIVEGAAMPGGSTKWCKPQTPRLSRDGTSEFLNSLVSHPRVNVLRKQMWNSKDDMCNAALATIKEPCILLQMDCDEVYTSQQLEDLYLLFSRAEHARTNCAYFFCRYYVGPNIVITSNNTYGNRLGEWLRAWRFTPGMKFKTHEPPIMENFNAVPFLREMTAENGLVFQHFSWTFREQVEYKLRFYGYGQQHLDLWLRLQSNKVWPVNDLNKFLPWVGRGVIADLLWKP